MSYDKYDTRFLKGLENFRVAHGVTARAIEDYFSALDCPKSLAAYMLYKYDEHAQLVDLGFDPLHYDTVVDARAAYCATEFLSKYPELNLDVDREKVALEKFDEFEQLCRQTNRRFRNLSRDPLYTGRAVWLHTAVIRKIDRILGDFESDEFISMPDWGPGATTLIKRRFASPVNKFQHETGITRDLYALLPVEILKEVYPLWANHLLERGFPTFQIGNRVITVPKSAKTDRVIAIEPGINLWFQLSMGRMVSKRLRRFGIDLTLQAVNQQFAKVGSATGQLATVDLSSASDSISREVVEALLPPRWYSVMDSARSRCGSQNGTMRVWEKFSSMGNGFTFPLESLIFYAVASVCAEYVHLGTSEVSVYGDDVILPNACFDVFSEMLAFYGFRINLKKSHYCSPFRESCGAHFFSGVDVTPIYLKDRLSDVPAIYRLANAIRRLSHRQMSYLACDSAFKPAFDHLVQSVPSALRLRVPDGLGDGGFIGCFDEATPVRAKHGVEGYRVKNAVEVSKTYLSEEYGYLLAALWKIDELCEDDSSELKPVERYARYVRLLSTRFLSVMRGTERRAMLKALITFEREASKKAGRNTVPLKGYTKIKVVKSIVKQWYDLGPWI